MNVPQHVAIILDGNGRWAKSKGMPRTYGHTIGAKNVETICRAAHNMGIRYLTFYAFSTENWNRPSAEVDALMTLLDNYLKTCLKTAKKNQMRIRVIGDITGLKPDFQASIKEVVQASAGYDGLNLTIAINYGSRDEIVRAVQKMAVDVLNQKITPDSIDSHLISSYLDTADIPDPDLMIRTSGEQRLSNFLLWQLAYAEFYFTEVPWPAFDENELRKAIEAYTSRDRRFGGVKEEKE
jgi:undecaprenyl diphosphate synthase